MKNKTIIVLAALFLCASSTTFAQSFITSGSNIISDPAFPNTKVGIGSSTPVDKLTVNGDISLLKTNDADGRAIMGRTNAGGLVVFANSTSTDGPYMEMVGRSNIGVSAGNLNFCNYNSQFQFFKYNPTYGTYSNQVTINSSGNMGINHATPGERLVIGNGDLALIHWDNDNIWRHITASSVNGGLTIGANTKTANSGAKIELSGKNGTNPGEIWMTSNAPQGFPMMMFNNVNPANNQVTNMMRLVVDDGVPKVTIGNVNDQTNEVYSLFVQNGILTEKLRVALANTPDWSDYVFASDYDLKPLEEVANFIKENKHLPNVPSAEEVVKDGIDVAKMDAKLLQKIEELTLYAIDQQKQLARQQQDIERLKKMISKDHSH